MKPVPYEPSWRDRANCAGMDADIFFGHARGDNLRVAEARRICAACTVRHDCLEYALTHSVRAGVWGGMTERERRTLRRLRAHQ